MKDKFGPTTYHVPFFQCLHLQHCKRELRLGAELLACISTCLVSGRITCTCDFLEVQGIRNE